MIKIKKNSTVVLIVAGGVGSRAEGNIPKQYQKISGDTVLNHNINNFLDNETIDHIRIVINKNAEKIYLQNAIKNPKIDYVFGGEQRQDSVRLGLQSLKDINPEKVLIHDGARPFVSNKLIMRILNELDTKNAVIPIIKVTDTIKEIYNNKIKKTLKKEDLVFVQTPQAFKYKLINNFHEKSVRDNINVVFTDDASLCEYYRENVYFVEGDKDNIKITYKEDIKFFRNRRINEEIKKMIGFRVGNGFDVHSFCDDECEYILIGGVKIPHNRGLLGHSDADVVLHSIVDAMLGAVAEGDIGQHFPPNDDKWKGVDSTIFIKHADSIIKNKGAEIANIDVTIICEKPKISSYREAIRKNIANMLEVDIDKVSIKATTTEKKGFLGREEAIAAQTNILLSFG